MGGSCCQIRGLGARRFAEITADGSRRNSQLLCDPAFAPALVVEGGSSLLVLRRRDSGRQIGFRRRTRFLRRLVILRFQGILDLTHQGFERHEKEERRHSSHDRGKDAPGGVCHVECHGQQGHDHHQGHVPAAVAPGQGGPESSQGEYHDATVQQHREKPGLLWVGDGSGRDCQIPERLEAQGERRNGEEADKDGCCPANPTDGPGFAVFRAGRGKWARFGINHRTFDYNTGVVQAQLRCLRLSIGHFLCAVHQCAQGHREGVCQVLANLDRGNAFTSLEQDDAGSGHTRHLRQPILRQAFRNALIRKHLSEALREQVWILSVQRDPITRGIWKLCMS